jgi:two-component sensor histidine kinase
MPRSIANKISLAALSLTMAVVLTLGTASYLFTRHTLKEQIKEKLSFEAALISHRLEARLDNINNDMRNMSANLIVVNALVDSAGREMYVEPFLRSYHLPQNIPCLLTLCDFSGHPIISCQGPEKLRVYSDQPLLTQVITHQRPLARLEQNEQGSNLLIAYPVLYGATGQAEGLLVLELPLSPLVSACLPKIPGADGHIFKLSDKGGEIWTTAKDHTPSILSTTIQLKGQAPLDQLALALTVGQESRLAYASLTTLTGIYLVIGILILQLTIAASRFMAKKLTAPLVALTITADQVTKSNDPTSQITVTSHDEITQLAFSFKTMLARLQESHDSLEQRVAERTRELHSLNAELVNEVAERIRAEAKTREYVETQAVLLREVNHRVKNNLVAIISMLHQEEDRAREKGMQEYEHRIQKVVWRVAGLLTVHRLLSSSEWKPLPLSQLCESVIQETLKGLSASSSIRLSVSPSDLCVDSDQAHSLAMVLNELSTNTMKYALCGRDTASISVAIEPRDGSIQLTYQDDGPGFPEPLLRGDFSDSGIGITLVNGLVTRNMQGTITLANDNGGVARISFPAKAPEPAA